MRRVWIVAAAALALGGLAGCVMLGDRLDQARYRLSIPFFVFDNAPNYCPPAQVPVMNEPVNVAVAVSGGGVRSAVFAAGVMEQLAAIPDPRNGGASLMDNLTAVGGVSGGSMAATYFCLYKPDRFADPAETAAFFQRFKSNMTLDVWMRGWAHYLSHPWEGAARYYTRYRFVQSYANAIDRHLFRGATFEDLNRREARGESPPLVVHAASLDTGRRFLFTNLNTAQNFAVDPRKVLERIPAVAPARDRTGLTMLAQMQASPVCRSFGFDTINSDIRPFRLASAIAASSGYPLLPGPAALIDYATKGYVHVADGGINDNFSMDALVEMYLARLQRAPRANRLVIISIDATGTGRGKDKSGDPDGYTGVLTYGSQAFIHQTTRAQTFANVLYGNLDSIRVIPIRLREMPGHENLEDLAMGGSISEKDMHFVLNAAAQLTAAHRDEILQAVRR